VVEKEDDQAKAAPIASQSRSIGSTANPAAAGFRHRGCLRSAGRKTGRLPNKRQVSWSRVWFARPGAAREIKYSDWRKYCFKTPGTNMVCRTTISGTFETGQSAVRIDLIEREGDKAARLQLFLPVGLYLQAGVKITIDQGAAYRIPYVWCLTNTCIAADLADPRLLKEMESGQKLLLEVVDSSVLMVGTSLPLNQFAAVRQGNPAQTFEQAIDE
jgi:invasion protein IalB